MLNDFEFETFHVGNLPLLVKVRDGLIEIRDMKTGSEVERTFDMTSWILPFQFNEDTERYEEIYDEEDATNICRTSLCLAGLVFVKNRMYKKLLNWFFDPDKAAYSVTEGQREHWPFYKAADMLKITYDDAQHLFFYQNWPSHYWEKYYSDDPDLQIQAGIDYLNEIIAENQKYLEYVNSQEAQ